MIKNALSQPQYSLKDLRLKSCVKLFCEEHGITRLKLPDLFLKDRVFQVPEKQNHNTSNAISKQISVLAGMLQYASVDQLKSIFYDDKYKQYLVRTLPYGTYYTSRCKYPIHVILERGELIILKWWYETVKSTPGFEIDLLRQFYKQKSHEQSSYYSGLHRLVFLHKTEFDFINYFLEILLQHKVVPQGDDFWIPHMQNIWGAIDSKIVRLLRWFKKYCGKDIMKLQYEISSVVVTKTLQERFVQEDILTQLKNRHNYDACNWVFEKECKQKHRLGRNNAVSKT